MGNKIKQIFIAATIFLSAVLLLSPVVTKYALAGTAALAAGNTTTKPGNSPANSAANNSGTANYNGTTIGNVDYDKETGGELNKLIHADSVPEFIGGLIKGILLMLTILSIIVILIGAFRMAMSQGNTEAITAGKRTVTWAILGLVVALLSYSIVAILQSVLGV